MVRAERQRLSGRDNRRSIVLIAVEVRQPKGFGCVRMRHVPDASAASLLPFLCDAVGPGEVVCTDGRLGYNPGIGRSRTPAVLAG